MAMAGEAPMKVDSEKVDMPDPSDQADFRADIWGTSFLVALLMMTPVLLLGLTSDMGNPDPLNTDAGWNTDVLLQVAIPAFGIWAITGAVISRLPTMLGFGMLKEKGYDIGVKDSIRTNMTNSGIVLALFLTMILGMWQEDKTGDPLNRVDIWYRVFLLFAIEACARGVIIVSAFLVYMEPLEEEAAQHFAVDNMIYLGEPTSCVFVTILYFLQACLLWVFNTDAKYVGCVAYLVVGWCLMRVGVVWGYLRVWQSPLMEHHVREARKSKLNMAKAADGTGGMKKIREQRPSDGGPEGPKTTAPAQSTV